MKQRYEEIDGIHFGTSVLVAGKETMSIIQSAQPTARVFFDHERNHYVVVPNKKDAMHVFVHPTNTKWARTQEKDSELVKLVEETNANRPANSSTSVARTAKEKAGVRANV